MGTMYLPPAVRHFDAHGFPAQAVEITQAHQASLGGVEDVDGAFDGELGVSELAELVPVEGQQLVVPGDQLVTKAQLVRTRGDFGLLHCDGYVDGELAASADFKFALKKGEDL